MKLGSMLRTFLGALILLLGVVSSQAETTPAPAVEGLEEASLAEASTSPLEPSEQTPVAEDSKSAAAEDPVEPPPTPETTPPKPVDDSGDEPAEGRPSKSVAKATPVSDPVSDSDVPDIDEWRDRIDSLLVGLAASQLTAEDANALYWELDEDLWRFHRVVRRAIDEATPDFIDLHVRLVDLFDERNRLFDVISPDLRAEIHGGGPLGRAELRHEVAYLQTTIKSQLLALRDSVHHVTDNITDAPLSTLWEIVQLVLGILVFRAWRRWSKTGLPEVRDRLLRAQPRQPVNLRLARLLWYAHRVGGSLAWLLLILFIERVVQPRGFQEIFSLVTTVLIWIFLARLIVQLIDATSARAVGGMAKERSRLRLRSLRLLAAWSLILGLGLTLVNRYVGQGAVHAWVVRTWEVLSIPVALLLIQWWRGEINDRLGELVDQSDWARRLAGRDKGFVSYFFAVAGAVFLLWTSLFKRFVRILSGWESGRRVLAILVRREVARDVSEEGHVDESPISEEMKARILGGRDQVLEDVAREQITRLAATLRMERGGGFVVLGERGAGKTVFLGELAKTLEGSILVTDCPPDGFDALEAKLGEQLGLDPGADLQTELPTAIGQSAIKIIGIDNAQRLARPWLGGQQGLDRLAALDARLNGAVGWVLMIDRRSWPYILTSRGERALFQQVLELPAWTEDQLAELIRARSHAAGIHADYRRLVLPRQLDAGEHESIDERNRMGYSRILWELADGNPEVALYVFVASLRQIPGDRVTLRLPQPKFSAALVDANVEALLVLRVVIQCDIATIDDISRSLRVSESRAQSMVRFCQQNGWLEEEAGGFRVTWDSFRIVTQALARQNLMPR